MEHQIGYQLFHSWFTIIEHRYNEYRNEIAGWGIGIEHKINI